MNARFAAFLAALALAAGSSANAATVHPNVHRALREQGTVDLVIELAQTTESTLESIKESAYSSRAARLLDVTSKLQAQNVVASAEVTKMLSQESTGLHGGFKNFWISNKVMVKAASFELLEKLAALPSVGSIREQIRIKFEDPVVEEDTKELVLGQQQWGVKKIGATAVWADGNIGQGVIVSTIDSGVRLTHEALKRNFRGQYGWFDPQNQSDEPNDKRGHGTHTMGTIAGSKGIGVAPGATWMACQTSVDKDNYIIESNLVDCAQWILCPTDTKGKHADCTKAPHVVSNSWGSTDSDPWFQSAVDAWVKAGIVPVFSAGNAGRKGCNTVGSPGDYKNVIGVGATTVTDGLADFSSKGVAVNGRRKPDISAPGRFVYSSLPDSDTSYGLKSGTSMAAPHVTGAVALLLSSTPDLSIEEVKIALYTTTDQKGLESSNYTCGDTPDAVWPNNQYGHGRLNILSAYQGFRPAATN